MQYLSLHVLLSRADSSHWCLFIHLVKNIQLFHILLRSLRSAVHGSVSAHLKLVACGNPTWESELFLLLSVLSHRIDDCCFPPEFWQSAY